MNKLTENEIDSKEVLWNEYSEKYNALCNQLVKLRINNKLLDEVIKAREKIGFAT